MISRVTIYRDPRTDIYQFNYLGLDGRRKRESTGTKLRHEAEALRAKKAQDLLKANALGLKDVNRLNTVSFEAFVTETYLPSCAPPNHTLRTFEGDCMMAEKVLPHFKGQYLAQIGTGDIERFINSMKTSPLGHRKCESCDKNIEHAQCPRKRSPATLNRYRNFLSGVFSAALRHGLVDGNPVRAAKKFKEENEIVRCLTDAEEKRLFAFSVDWLRPILTFALHTGTRQAEILGLRWADIDLDAQEAVLTHTKSRKSRTVPLNSQALAAIKEQDYTLAGGVPSPFVFTDPEASFDPKTGKPVPGPYDRVKIAYAFTSAVEKAGIAHFRFHDCRHTAATRIYRRTKDLQAVQRLLGHSVVTTTARYTHTLKADVRAAVEALETPVSRRPVSMASAKQISVAVS